MTADRERRPLSGIRLALLNSSYQGLASLYYLAIRSIYVILFARALGVDQYGAYVYSQSWYLLALTFASWGMNELAIAEYSRRGPERGRAVLEAGYALRLLLCSALVGVLGLIAFLIESDSELRLLILIYSQAVLARGATNWYSALFVAHERSQFWLYLTIPFLTLEVVVAVTLAISGAGLVAIAVAQCAVWWLLLFACMLVYRLKFGGCRPRLNVNYTRFFLRNGFSLALAALAFSSLGSGILIVCRHFAGTGQALGEAAFAIQVVVIIGHAIKVVSNAALPPLARTTGEQAWRQTLYVGTVWSQAILLGSAAFLVANLVLPPLVNWGIGPDFLGAAEIFARYCWLLIPLPIIYGLRLALISNQRANNYLLAILAGLILLALQVGLQVATGRVDIESLLTALGVTHFAIALLVLLLVMRVTAIPPVADLLLPILLLPCSFALYSWLQDELPLVGLLAGLAPLLAASAWGVVKLRRRILPA